MEVIVDEIREVLSFRLSYEKVQERLESGRRVLYYW